ncbi:MAG: hypothetical protein HKN04_03560 [Rhodothermaceae bacterium]|nr:hypothetical protein [Rhodothermaceae bacterium]
MTRPNYDLVGKRVRVHLYDRAGRLLGTLEGRVADVSAGVPVGKSASGETINKDLAYVVDIMPVANPEGEPTAYKNSAGTEGEGWFAIQDLTILGEGPRFPMN